MKIFNKKLKAILLLIGMVAFTVPTFAISLTANAGADQELNITASNPIVILDGTASTGTITQYEWFYNGSSIGTGVTLNVGAVPLGYYTVELVITDSLGNTASDTVNIDVRLTSSTITSNAGSDINVTLTPSNSTLTLDGTASTGTIVQYEWFYNGDSIGMGSTLNVGSVPPGYYTVMLMVTDSLGNMASDTVNIEVTVNSNPDSDGDYIPNAIETLLGMDSSNNDEDGDGILDGLQLTGTHGDTFFDYQWHIKSTGANSSPYATSTTIIGNDLNVMDIYHAYMGYNAGSPLVIQVVDTGVDADHEDLIDNMDLSLSRNSNTQSMGDPVETVDSAHGTMCAGIIGARAFNGKGVRGVAPFAKIAGSNWLSNQSGIELEEAWTKNDPNGKIIIASNSWGTESASANTYYEDLMAYASANLRKVSGVAYGKLFIKAAGNGRTNNHDSSLSYASSNPYVITVAALKSDNTHASYSSPGTNILVSGYSGDYFQNSATIGTTYIATRSALAGNLTYNDTKSCFLRTDGQCSMPTWADDALANKSYTYGMNGTSAATPTVAGSLGLVLEACPTLPWRDVKYLIAKNAIQIDNSNASWETNSAGLHHSVDYGFGLINPSAMITECTSSYTNLPTSSTVTENFDPTPDIAIPDNNTTGISYDFTVVNSKTIEWLGVTVTSNHTWGGDLEIYLTSPSGTTTRLMKGNNSGSNYSLSAGFRYGSVAFMGENSVGTWTLKITDIANVDTGNLESLSFEVFGH